MKTLVVTKIKNDNKWLDEWIKHHLSFGVSDILIYDNNDGFEDYPMSDYVINMCSLKRIKIVNARNKAMISLPLEINNIDISMYDFVIILDVDEYIVSKSVENINDALENEGMSLELAVYPYKEIGGKKSIDLSRYSSYGQRKLHKVSFGKLMELSNYSSSLYIEKYPYRKTT